MNTNMNTTFREPVSVQITHNFHLPESTVAVCDKYFILYWEAHYLYSSLLRCPRIIKDEIPFVPVFLPGMTLEDLACNPYAVIRCSFRKLHGHRTGYVICAPAPSSTRAIGTIS